MKERELRKHATCSLCNKPIGASGLPLFWIVKIQRFGIDIGAMRRQDGLAAMLGSPVLAGVMGADEDMAKPVSDEATMTVCENCCCKSTCVAEMSEQAKGGDGDGHEKSAGEGA